MNKFILDVARGYYKDEGWPRTTYGVSKIGVTSFTKILARENKNILINACCPGFVKTDMSSNNPSGKSPDAGAEVPVWLATLPQDSKIHGGFFRDKNNETIWEDY